MGFGSIDGGILSREGFRAAGLDCALDAAQFRAIHDELARDRSKFRSRRKVGSADAKPGQGTR
jgi:hypothetical protein